MRQSLRWLTESRRWEPKVAEWRKEWLAALKAAQEAQACLLPPKSRLRESTELPKLFDRLVANAPHRELKEDSLWTAGETFLQDGYFLHFRSGDWNQVINGVPPQGDEFAARRSQQILPRQHLQDRTSGRGFDNFTLPIEPKHFERLVKDYSTSPLVSHAKLRLATVNRWKLESSRQRLWDVENPDDLWTRLKPLEAVSVTKGTYPDAWIRLERGLLHFQHGDYESALAIFEAVADEMPVSAEKEAAMLNTVQCQLLLQKNADALRQISQLEALPDISFQARYSHYYAHSDWSVHFLSVGLANTRHFTQQFKATIEKLKKNDEFQKWFAERKAFPPRKSR